MADVNSTHNLTATVERKEVLIDSGWNFFKTLMVALGGAAIIGWVGWLGYHWGSAGCYTCTQNKPTVATVGTPPVPPSTQTTETAILTEIEKDLSAIGRILLEEKEATQASALAAASATTTVVVPPPKAERRVTITKQAESVCPCPSPAQTMPIVGQAPPPPSAPTLSSVERRRNEMWSALRR